MYCKKCGRENDDDAAFCQRCGTAIGESAAGAKLVEVRDAEVETRVAGRAASVPDVPGEKIFSINPTLKFVAVGYFLAVLAAFVLVALIAVFVSSVSPLAGVVLGLLLLLIPAYFHIRQKLIRYSLTDTAIEIDRGFISRTTQTVPLRRVQDVTVKASAMQRLLGYGDIEIDNASENGGKIVLDDIDRPRRHAEMILRQMRELER